MVNSSSGTNYYEVLEVAPDAPPSEIHKAYQKAKSTYSTDNPALYSMFTAEEARELLRIVEEAYMVLGNPSLRKTYDEARLNGEANVIDGLGPVATSSPTFAPSASSPAPSVSSNGASSNGVSGGVSGGAPASAPVSTPPSPTSYGMPPAFMPQNSSSAHASAQKMPDFAPPDTAAVLKQATPSQTKQALPPGMGRTGLSTYKIDDAFETEIAGSLDFDGNLIQRVRLYKNISIDKMSEATRISRTYLMALETNDYKNLPAAVFVRGFAVQVARALGLDENKVASSYIKLFKAGGGK